jgi:hypothetical protein
MRIPGTGAALADTITTTTATKSGLIAAAIITTMGMGEAIAADDFRTQTAFDLI